MSFLSLLRNVPREFVDLPGVITIDSGLDDGRFLPAMRTHFPSALRHDSFAQAFNNIAGASQATIIGHGVQAYVATGLGTIKDHAEGKHLCLPHADKWKAVIDGLPDRKVTHLTIFACSVGFGTAGADFVAALAQKLKATVMAPLGDVWADAFSGKPCIMKDGGWQKATPTVAPDVRAAPRIALTTKDVRRTLPRNMVLFDANRFLPIPLTAIRSAEWEALVADADPGERSWIGEAARGTAAQVAFDTPLIFGGTLASFVTGRLTFSYTLLGRDVTREFRVHNDRLLEDAEVPGVFYEVNLPAVLRSP